MGSEGSTNSSSNIDMYSRVKLDGRVCGSGRDNSAIKIVESMDIQGKKIMANNDVNSRGISSKKECADSMVKRKALVLGGNDKFPSRSLKKARLSSLAKQEAVISCRNIKGDMERRDGQVDDLIEVGDMVWGRVESHRWWPGQVFSEAFACTSVCNTKKKGRVLVSFFGDDSYGWFERSELIPFEPHFTEKSKQSNSLDFLTAVEEAQDELNKRAALGFTCLCRKPNNFRPTHVPRFFEVDVNGFDYGCVYSQNQIERARNDFLPIDTLKFLRELASMPQSGMKRDVEHMKNLARLVAYRRAVFEEFDETIPPEFLVQSVCPGGSVVVSDLHEGCPPASLRVKRGTKNTIGTRSPRTAPNTDHSCSSSKPPKKMPFSGEKSIKKATAVKETKPLTGEKKATNKTPLEVKDNEKMVGPTEPTRVAMKFSRRSPLSSVAEMKGKKIMSSGEKPVQKPTTNPMTIEKKVTNQTHLDVQGDEKMVGPTVTEPTRVAMKLPRRSASVAEMKGKKIMSSGEKPVAKPTALNETKPLTVQKKAENQTPLEVQGDEQTVGPTEPTRVVMKFPRGSLLPSVSEMKAKFARFGKLDEQGMRVFWNTSTCQVVFKKVSSAQAAYDALQNKVLFCNANAYSLRALKVSFPSGSGETSKPVKEESRNGIPKLKSILKKSSDGENRFVMSIPQAVAAINRYYQEEARKNESSQTTSSSSNGVDISEPMKILLTKCFDIVADHGFMF